MKKSYIEFPQSGGEEINLFFTSAKASVNEDEDENNVLIATKIGEEILNRRNEINEYH